MTGAWARACDKQDMPPNPETAALLISQKLWNNRYLAGELLVKDVELAGACIRAWRQSLPDQGERRDDVTDEPTERLLWLALDHVCRAQFRARTGRPSVAAFPLRSAEAALRTWWKRSQQ